MGVKKHKNGDSTGAEGSYVDRERDEIEDLNRRIKAVTPVSGTLSTSGDQKKFNEFPLSKLTLKGLSRGKFEVTTEIQRQALPHALAGRDILGAAKTGSGKTLAYLIPLVEDLFRVQWSREDGLGAMVISPTRELALQIYEVAKVLLYSHAFTAGLLLGGTDFTQEQKSALKMQVAICTPGRALQHLEQTPGFDISSTLRVLVLDEADRLLDLGFRNQLEAIVSYTPKPREEGGLRQTMLFSATQTKSVKDLARLSLSAPEYISVHEKEQEATPASLRQLYICAELGDKLDVVFSFIKSHLKSKTIIFFSSCKQVKFMDVAFRRMRPGVPIMALHGKQSPAKRTMIYEDFVSRPAAVLFATDVAARGLDFPNVDWVVQADCPEDAAGYIHRVGRTARYNRGGNALLVLLPNEEKPFLSLLEQHKIPIKRLGVNPMRRQSIQEKLRGLLIADTELKLLAQKAFKAYLRSVHLQTNREVFDVKKLPFKEFASSLGLSSTPRIKFAGKGGEAGRKKNRELKNKNYLLEQDDFDGMEEEKGRKRITTEGDEESGMDEDEEEMEEGVTSDEEEEDENQANKTSKKAKKKSKWERVMSKKPLASRVRQDEDGEEAEDDDDAHGGLLIKKDRTEGHVPAPSSKPSSNKPPQSITAIVRQKARKLKPLKIADDGEVETAKMKPQIAEFDEEGETLVDPFDRSLEGPNAKQRQGEYVKRLTEKLRTEDLVDREVNRKRVKEKHREQKQKRKALRRTDEEGGDDDDQEERVVTLGHASDDEDYDHEEDEEDVERAAMRLIEQGV